MNTLASVLADVDGFVSVGITRVGEDYAVKVNVRKLPIPGVALPDSVGGVSVKVEAIGVVSTR